MTRLQISAALFAAFVLGTVALGGVLAINGTFDQEVRITARRLDDGRTEFALQQREGNSWGERQFPRQRFFPANPGHDRWLNSSRLAVSVEQQSADPASSASPAELSSLRTPVAPASNADQIPADAIGQLVVWSAQQVAGVGFRSIVGLGGVTDDSLYRNALLVVYCDADAPNAQVVAEVRVSNLIADQEFVATLDDDGLPAMRLDSIYADWDRAHTMTVTRNDRVRIGPSNEWFEAVRSASLVQFLLPTWDGGIIAQFDLGGKLDTPVTDRLDHCGEY